MRSGIPVPQHRNLHRPGLGETVLAVCPLRELPPSRLSGVVPGITQMVIRLTLEGVLDLHLGEQAASPVSCSPPARARSVSSRSSRSSAADRPPRPARGPLSRRSSVSPPSRNLHRSNFSPYLDGSGAGLSTGATGWSKLRLSATSISCSIPTGDPSITPMIPRPRFVTATRMSTGLAVAQKMVQTSGTALTGFSTLTGKPSLSKITNECPAPIASAFAAACPGQLVIVARTDARAAQPRPRRTPGRTTTVWAGTAPSPASRRCGLVRHRAGDRTGPRPAGRADGHHRDQPGRGGGARVAACRGHPGAGPGRSADDRPPRAHPPTARCGDPGLGHRPGHRQDQHPDPGRHGRRQLWAPAGEATISGTGYGPDGQVHRDGHLLDPAAGRDVTELLTSAALCNDPALLPPDGGQDWTAAGDPTEAALLTAAARLGLRPAANRQHAPGQRDPVRQRPQEDDHRAPAARRRGAGDLQGSPETLLDPAVLPDDPGTGPCPRRATWPGTGSGCSPWQRPTCPPSPPRKRYVGICPFRMRIATSVISAPAAQFRSGSHGAPVQAAGGNSPFLPRIRWSSVLTDRAPTAAWEESRNPGVCLPGADDRCPHLPQRRVPGHGRHPTGVQELLAPAGRALPGWIMSRRCAAAWLCGSRRLRRSTGPRRCRSAIAGRRA